MPAATPARPRARFTRLTGDNRRAALIAAALSSIAKGVIQAITVDRVCHRAATSRLLSTPHFGSMSALPTANDFQFHTTSLPPQPGIIARLDHLFSRASATAKARTSGSPFGPRFPAAPTCTPSIAPITQATS